MFSASHLHRTIIAGFILVFVLAEVALRASLHDVRTATESQKLVVKFLTDTRPAIAVGDSHVGSHDKLPDVAFLGRGGITIHELVTLVQSRPYKTQRLIIEAGPQMFAKHRLVRWRTIQPGSFSHQSIFPLRFYLAEPELRNFAKSRLVGLVVPKAWAMTRKEALEFERKFRKEAYSHRRVIRWTDRPADVRRALSLSRRDAQRPVANLTQTDGWKSFTRMVKELVRQGTDVCLIRTPMNHEYEALLQEQWNRGFAQHRKAVIDLARDAGANYVDYMQMGFAKLHLSYFDDNDHLNRDGRKLYWSCLKQACFGGSAPLHCRIPVSIDPPG